MSRRDDRLGRGPTRIALTLAVITLFASVAGAQAATLRILHVDRSNFPTLRLIVSGGWTGPRLDVAKRESWTCRDEDVETRVLSVHHFVPRAVPEEVHGSKRTHFPLHLGIVANARDSDEGALWQIAECLGGRVDEDQREFWSRFVKGLATEIWAPNCHPRGRPGRGPFTAGWQRASIDARVDMLNKANGRASLYTYQCISKAIQTQAGTLLHSHDALVVVLDERDLLDKDMHRIPASRYLKHQNSWTRDALREQVSVSFLVFGVDEDSDHHAKVIRAVEGIATATGGVCATSSDDEEEVRRAFRTIATHLQKKSAEQIAEIEILTPNLDPSRLRREVRLSCQSAAGPLTNPKKRRYEVGGTRLLAIAARDTVTFRASITRLLNSADQSRDGRIVTAHQVLKSQGTDEIRAQWDSVLIDRIRTLDPPDPVETALLVKHLFDGAAQAEAELITDLAAAKSLLDAGRPEEALESTRRLMTNHPEEARARELCVKAHLDNLRRLSTLAPRRWAEEFALVARIAELDLADDKAIETFRHERIDAFIAAVPERTLEAVDSLEREIRGYLKNAPTETHAYRDSGIACARVEVFAAALDSENPDQLIPSLVYFGTRQNPPAIEGRTDPTRDAIRVLMGLGDDRFPDLVSRLAESASRETHELPATLAQGVMDAWDAVLEESPTRGITLANAFLARPALPLSMRRRMWSDALERAVATTDRAPALAGRCGELLSKDVASNRTWLSGEIDRLGRAGNSRLALEVFLTVLETEGEILPVRGEDARISVLRRAAGLGGDRRDLVWRAWTGLESAGRARVADERAMLRTVADAALAGYHFRDLDALLAAYPDRLEEQTLRFRRIQALIRMHLATCRLIAAGWETGHFGPGDTATLRNALKATNRDHWTVEGIREARGEPGDRPFLRWDDSTPWSPRLVFPLDKGTGRARLVVEFRVDREGPLEKDHDRNLHRQWRDGAPRVLALLAERVEGVTPSERDDVLARGWAALRTDALLGAGNRVEYVLIRMPGRSEPAVFPASSERTLRETGLLDLDGLNREREYHWEKFLEAYPESFAGGEGLLVVAVRWDPETD